MNPFVQSLFRLQRILDSARQQGIDLDAEQRTSIWDFKGQREASLRKEFGIALHAVQENATLLYPLAQQGHDAAKQLMKLSGQQPLDMKEMLLLAADLPKEESFGFSLPRLPGDISDEIKADVAELKQCFDSQCYRSCVILCARILEVALHRKYYDATGQDILEKSPGIGLGNLIAKMKEKSIELDPAITQQIHLINHVRVFSVHKKQQAFNPGREQTHAILLYTLSVLRNLFV